jgi:hypothetical protein
VIGALKRGWDNFRGSGAAAVTVPSMDGALRPNRLLEEALLVAGVESPDDLAYDGTSLLVSSGTRLCRVTERGTETLAEFGSTITAVAATPFGRIAAALAEGIVAVTEPDGTRSFVTRLGDGRASCVTALRFERGDTLLVAQGSTRREAAQWKRDLMERRSDGAVWRTALDGRAQERLADGLAWPLGIAVGPDDRLIVSESWRHRLIALGRGRAPEPVLADLPGYPARIHPDPAGGYWLALFAPRNQIIEFIQREPAFLTRMMDEVDEAYWAAPSLKPSATFLEPLQGGAQKHLGMLKPWAPTRSYGLVVHLDGKLRPTRSFHSRADGTRHGVMTALPVDDFVLAAARGGHAVVALDRTGAGTGA